MAIDFKFWLETEEVKKNAIHGLINGQNLIFFFTKDDNIFGAPEESRLVFAKMKNPDEDVPSGWVDDANFIAFDLAKALIGQKIQNMFSNKDLKQINIIDKDKAEKILMKHAGDKTLDQLKAKQSKYGAGMVKLKDGK